MRIEPSTCSLEVTKSNALTNCAMGAILVPGGGGGVGDCVIKELVPVGEHDD